MTRLLTLIVFLLIGQYGFAQTQMNFRSIDKHVSKTPKAIEKDLPKLVKYLTAKSSNDFEKVRSFYIWLVTNIEYDNAALKKDAKRINQSNQEVLNRKKAVCQGYSNLLQEMCFLSNIPCEVIVGYSKTPRDAAPDLSIADHTWNAILTNEKWYLLDPTWGAGNKKGQLEDYFLTAPEIFVIDHLPNDPMWQLLDCPISAQDFTKDENFITNRIQNQTGCFNFKDSIRQFIALTKPERKLKNAINGYRFNPVDENKKYLGSMYMEMVGYLSDRAYELELKDSIKALETVQLEIIETCEKASKYVGLYNHQKTNLAYTHLNYAVALSRKLPELETKKDIAAIVDCYKKMLHHFEKGRAILTKVPPNFLSENGLEQFDEYIEYVQLQLKQH